ncbi:MAG: sugar dehydratase [Acidobacteria bacterium]|nr:MAG: sugar dehydratase [Acidobacteriota bacterium]
MDRTEWANQVALVTGGSGFVGANLTAKLLSLGTQVIVLERDRPAPNSLDVLGIRDKTTLVTGSVDDLFLCERLLNDYQPGFVFHLAAQALVGAANRSPLSTFEANIRGTYVLLEACRRYGQASAVVVASSDKAYGIHSELPYKEQFELKGQFPYDVSKACTDLISRSFAATFDLPVTITRSANIYGPGDINLSRIIPGTIVSALKGERPVIRSDGTPVREFIHVDDVVDGYLTLAENIDISRGEAFNFGTDEPVKIIDLVEMIIRLAGRTDLEPEILLTTKIAGEIDAQYLSGEKMAATFDWKPRRSLEDGIQESIEWYRQHLDAL